MEKERKVYKIPLKDDLSGWEEIEVVAVTVLKFGRGKPAQLKEEFAVKDDPASPAPGIEKGWLKISGKEILPSRDGVRFKVGVSPGADWRELEKVGRFLLTVEVQLDLSPAAGIVSQVLGAMGATGAGAAVPTGMNLIAGTCAVQVDVPRFTISLRKFRFGEIVEKDLAEYVSSGELAELYREGGELWVPVKVQKEQSENGRTIVFEDIAVYDVEGELNWMGVRIPGVYRDDEDPRHEYIVFKIPRKIPGEMPGAPDLAPDSPTKKPAGIETQLPGNAGKGVI